MKDFAKIAVVGAGIMGHGIALVCALAGRQVALIDVSSTVLAHAKDTMRQAMDQLVENSLALEESIEPVLAAIQCTETMAEGLAGATLVFEVVPERMPLKQHVYAQLEQFADPDTVFASNTSGIPINHLASMTRRPQLFVGAHFFMPAHLLPLVEVIQGDATDPDVVARLITFLIEAGKSPVWVRKDIPGFIGNRLQHALAREAMSLVQKGIATMEDVDTVVKKSLALRLPFTGPIEQRDFNGLDTHMSIASYLYADLEDSKTPLPLLADRVAAGDLGIKTGKGFYDWTKKDVAQEISNKNKKLIDMLHLLKSM